MPKLRPLPYPLVIFAAVMLVNGPSLRGQEVLEKIDPPSLNDMLSQWETAWRKKVEALQQQNRIYEGDLSKWQQWYQWASGEIQTTRASRDQAAARVAAVEAELQRAQMAMKAGQTTQAQVDRSTTDKHHESCSCGRNG